MSKVWENHKFGSGKTTVKRNVSSHDPEARAKRDDLVTVTRTREGKTAGGRPYKAERETKYLKREAELGRNHAVTKKSRVEILVKRNGQVDTVAKVKRKTARGPVVDDQFNSKIHTDGKTRRVTKIKKGPTKPV